MNAFDHGVVALLRSSEKGLKISSLNEDSNPDHCDASALLNCYDQIHSFQSAIQIHYYSVITIYVHIYGLTGDPHNDQPDIGLIAQLVEQCTGIPCLYIVLFTYLFFWMLKFKIGVIVLCIF